MKQQNESLPSALEAIFLVIGLFVAEYVVRAALLDLRAVSGVDPRDVSGVVAILGNGILFSVLLRYKRISYASLFHPSRSSVVATVGTLTIPVLLIVPGLIMVMWTIQLVLQSVFPLSHWQQALFDRLSSSDPVSVITVCVLAPILEEMLFRGIILRSFLHQYRPLYAILGSAVLFGLAHLNIYQFAAGVAVGIVSGWIYERARSLWPCILLHAAYNSAVTSIYLLFVSGDTNDRWEPSIGYWVGAFIFAFIGASLLQRLLAPYRAA